MTTKRIHFPFTTAQQRKLLFETWEATGNVMAACRKAHVGRGTFYYWKPRFEEYGYAGLEEFASRAPKEPKRTPPEVEQKVIDMRREHPDWGKKRIADELAKANNRVPLVTANTVKRILKDAALWEVIEAEAKKKQTKTSSRTAEEPGQTVNVDLCFVPATHEVADKLPAVSGSSGRLIVQRSQAKTEERKWPGRVFEDPELTYEEAMLDFIATSRKRENQQETESHEAEQTGQRALKAEKRVLRREEMELRDERRQIREKRKLENAAWKEIRAVRQAEEQTYQALSKEERRQQRQTKRARDERWQALREQRRVTFVQRGREDEAWREKRPSCPSALPGLLSWSSSTTAPVSVWACLCLWLDRT